MERELGESRWLLSSMKQQLRGIASRHLNEASCVPYRGTNCYLILNVLGKLAMNHFIKY
jgi:hypothetical protein